MGDGNRMRVRVSAAGGGCLLLALALAARAGANPLPTSADHVVAPGRNVASEDTAEAIALNPANLAWLPATELRWTWVQCPNEAIKVGCGHAWTVGTPLFFGLSTALRVDLVQPPWGSLQGDGVGFPSRGSAYVWVTWGLAAKLGEQVSFGLSLERSYSRDGYVDGLFGLSAALSWRPDPHFGFAAVASDFNRPSATLRPPAIGASEALPVLDGRYALALAFRPTGRRSIDVC